MMDRSDNSKYSVESERVRVREREAIGDATKEDNDGAKITICSGWWWWWSHDDNEGKLNGEGEGEK